MANFAVWFACAVCLALVHLALAASVLYFHDKPVEWLKLLRDGSLFFFAVTLSASGFAEYITSGITSGDGVVTAFAFLLCFVIILFSSHFYTQIVRENLLGAKARGPKISPKKTAELSAGASVFSIVYASALFLLRG